MEPKFRLRDGFSFAVVPGYGRVKPRDVLTGAEFANFPHLLIECDGKSEPEAVAPVAAVEPPAPPPPPPAPPAEEPAPAVAPVVADAPPVVDASPAPAGELTPASDAGESLAPVEGESRPAGKSKKHR